MHIADPVPIQDPLIMEARIHVPEDFEVTENCFLGEYCFVIPTNPSIYSVFIVFIVVVNFSHGQVLPSALNTPKFTLYQKTKDRTKKKRVMVR